MCIFRGRSRIENTAASALHYSPFLQLFWCPSGSSSGGGNRLLEYGGLGTYGNTSFLALLGGSNWAAAVSGWAMHGIGGKHIALSLSLSLGGWF